MWGFKSLITPVRHRIWPVGVLVILIVFLGAGGAGIRAARPGSGPDGDLQAPGSAKGGEKAVGFELKDQHNQASSYRFPKSKLTILIFGDRKGSEQIEGWVRPLWDRYQERIDQKGVAVLSAVPAFMRPIVRTMFRSQVKHSVLLDWTGDVSKAYGYKSGVANLYLIDREGQIVLKLTGPVNQSGLQQLCERIDRLLTAS